MPSCRPDVIPAVVYKILEIKPASILELGIGHGKWGVLCHEYLKYWAGVAPRIDGVEVFSEYRSPAYGEYGQVFAKDAVSDDVVAMLGNYDLVLAVDVIEHFAREDGLRVLENSKNYLISTPHYWHPQGASFGNAAERHVSHWRPEDFQKYELVYDRVGRRHIVAWGGQCV